MVIGFKNHGGGHIRIPLVVNFRNLNCTAGNLLVHMVKGMGEVKAVLETKTENSYATKTLCVLSLLLSESVSSTWLGA